MPNFGVEWDRDRLQAEQGHGWMHRGGSSVHLMEQQPEILRVDGLGKVYRSGKTDLVLFENLSFHVRKGEMLAIVGESGSGKSSLLHILGALDRASAGDVYCAQIPVGKLTDEVAAGSWAGRAPRTPGRRTLRGRTATCGFGQGAGNRAEDPDGG